jgi:hypothetical protein
MLTVTELRAAITAANPVAVLESLARRELDSGRTREQVSDEVAAALPELRRLSDYADGWEDQLVELVDRLTGWTHPTAQIHPAASSGSNGAPTGTTTKLPR